MSHEVLSKVAYTSTRIVADDEALVIAKRLRGLIPLLAYRENFYRTLAPALYDMVRSLK